MSQNKVDYASAGVDISAGNLAVEMIKEYAARTFNTHVLCGLGSFASFYDLTSIMKNYRHPVLVQSTDGVGTKIVVTRMSGDYTTVGRDLVSACANDIAVHGAVPLTFLDYIANDKLEPSVVAAIVKGICDACQEEGVCLVGGETAEMPGTYLPREHDLVGFVTGVVERDRIVNGAHVQEGDAVLAVGSTGLHTNGFSLARKVLFQMGGLTLDDPVGTGNSVPALTVGQALTAVHANYVSGIQALLSSGITVKSMAHITGGGLLENVPRVVPKHLSTVFWPETWDRLPIFDLIQRTGNITDQEMYRTFNMGIGLVVIVGAHEEQSALATMRDCFKQPVYRVGTVIRGNGQTLIGGFNTAVDTGRRP
ncbi:MAG: phosphoribosylformylglycinamidine cyclo-ligase [Sphaerochaetaceae bacterium]